MASGLATLSPNSTATSQYVSPVHIHVLWTNCRNVSVACCQIWADQWFTEALAANVLAWQLGCQMTSSTPNSSAHFQDIFASFPYSVGKLRRIVHLCMCQCLTPGEKCQTRHCVYALFIHVFFFFFSPEYVYLTMWNCVSLEHTVHTDGEQRSATGVVSRVSVVLTLSRTCHYLN